MENKEFSVGFMLTEGWKEMKNHLWFFIGFLLLFFVIPSIPYALAYGAGQDQADQQSKALDFFVWLTHYILFALVTIGLIKVVLAISIKESPKWSYLFSGFPVVLKFIVGQFLYTLITVVGLALLIVPGVVWGLRYMLYGFFIVDKGAGPIEAFHLSAQATKGAKWDLLALSVVGVLINLLGALCLFVGLFATIPIVMIAQAIVYRKLVAATNFAVRPAV